MGGFTLELFAGLVGAAFSLFFSWMPYVRTWFAKLDEEQQQLAQLILAVATAGFIVFSSCYDLWLYVTCDKAGVIEVVGVLFMFLVGNQVAHKVVPKHPEYKIFKAIKQAEG